MKQATRVRPLQRIDGPGWWPGRAQDRRNALLLPSEGPGGCPDTQEGYPAPPWPASGLPGSAMTWPRSRSVDYRSIPCHWSILLDWRGVGTIGD